MPVSLREDRDDRSEGGPRPEVDRIFKARFVGADLENHLAMSFDGESPQKWLVDVNQHLNDVHQRVPY